jgi:hypothetical protein
LLALRTGYWGKDAILLSCLSFPLPRRLTLVSSLFDRLLHSDSEASTVVMQRVLESRELMRDSETLVVLQIFGNMRGFLS